MKLKTAFTALLLYTFASLALAENPVILEKKPKTDANVVGHVVCNDAHIPFATVMIKGTTFGTTTDETGHFQLINLPSGQHTMVISMIGYKSQEKTIIIAENKTIELKFELEDDILNLDEVVISADRNAQKRTEAAVIVNTISPKLFTSSQSITIGEGLNFSPGLRLENNCQNCGFSQVRMNGMEGPYSQILINSRPIFSGLAGVYGLELIPANMIEKVEVVRGGGSALFGSNAIAGTINIILKDPIRNSYEGGANFALSGIGTEGTGGLASDYSANFNASVISDDSKSGMSVYGFSRQRDMFDANNDGYSEASALENLTFGARAFHRFNFRDKLAIDFFSIKEDRDGGNKIDYPMHERDISESLTHTMNVGAITYERFFRDYDMLTAYASSQFLKRDSYYGARQSLSDYGFTQGTTYNTGIQYKALLGDHASLVAGIENTGDFLNDTKLGYADLANAVITGDSIQSVPHTKNLVIANQTSTTTGAFAQYDFTINRLKIATGARLDYYSIHDKEDTAAKKTGVVFSPRISLMYGLTNYLQARVSYSQGYRAPQIFDEDLHIETSGSRKVIHKNDPNLTQESSHSYMASLDFNKMVGNVYTGLLVEAFHTRLNDAFANKIGVPNADGEVIYTRINSEGGASVQGINMELKLKPMKNIAFSTGFTLQTSTYDKAQDFDETHFFRTPNAYGFFTLDWDFIPGFCLSSTGNYTGKMLVPYFGIHHPSGELRTSDDFYDLGAKLSYTYKLNGASVEFSTGIKNAFNAYQNDFDSGIDRDPSYIYGPLNPRTLYFGIKFGNLL